jgi:phage terminase large subunit-like protein
MPWKPSEPGERPTLGFYVCDWIADNLAAPDRAEYEPFLLTAEQVAFVLRFYEVDPGTGKRLIRRAVLSRSRGWGKSPFLAALAIAEGLADVVSDGWNANGRPVGKPWCEVRTPLVQIAAVSEAQTKNSWTPLLEMVRYGDLIDNYPGLEPMETFVNLPMGRIETVTSSAQTVKGNRPIFAVLDQTEEWTRSNGGVRLAQVMATNSTKIGGSTIESPNAYIPGMESVAEQTATAHALMKEGRTRNDKGLLYDHREAPADTDMADPVSLMAGLTVAYGDSAVARGGWVDLDRIVAAIWDPDSDPQVARADYLNQITHASDSWISQPEWAAVAAPDKVVTRDDAVVLGFDGSRRRAEGVTDATALVGCRVSDGHLFTVEVWEQPHGVRNWEIPTLAVDLAVREAFKKWNIVGMFADPALWESYIAAWEAAFVKKLKVKKTGDHPIRWSFSSPGRIVEATKHFHSAVLDGELSHDASSVLTRHVLSARRRHAGNIGKAYADSPDKIDAAIAGILAWDARLAALAAGVAEQRRRGSGRILVLD